MSLLPFCLYPLRQLIDVCRRHEHLYKKVEGKLIRTDSLPDDPLAAHRLLLGSRVILSTLSNMLNNRMAEITRIVPVETLVIDEASQIDVGDYLPVIHRHQRKLQKLVFIGDDKQRGSIIHISGVSGLTVRIPIVAPYGYEQIKELESIFEKRHLRGNAILLDTQCEHYVSSLEILLLIVTTTQIECQSPSATSSRNMSTRASSRLFILWHHAGLVASLTCATLKKRGEVIAGW